MNDENAPEKEPTLEPLNRREFLQRVGKAAVYAAPVVAYIASSNRAVAMSGFGGGEN